MRLKMSDFENLNTKNTKEVEVQEAKKTELPTVAAAPAPKKEPAFMTIDPAIAPLVDVMNDELFMQIVASISDSDWNDRFNPLTIPAEFAEVLSESQKMDWEDKLNLVRDQDLMAQDRDTRKECIEEFFERMRSYKECQELISHLEAAPQTHAIKKQIEALRENMKQDEIWLSSLKDTITGKRFKDRENFRNSLVSGWEGPGAHFFDPLRKETEEKLKLAEKNSKKGGRFLSLVSLLSIGCSVGYFALKLFTDIT